MSVPAPPYSSGISIPISPISPISLKMSRGKVWSRSRSWMPGRTRSSAKRRTSSRRSCWSSLSEKSMPDPATWAVDGASVSTAMMEPFLTAYALSTQSAITIFWISLVPS